MLFLIRRIEVKANYFLKIKGVNKIFFRRFFVNQFYIV